MPFQTSDECTFTGPVYLNGVTSLPAGCVTSANINGSSPIEAAKLGHQYEPVFSQAGGSFTVAERKAVHVAKGAGTLVDFRAGPVVAATGDSTATVDLQKNGVTMLTAPITLDNSKAAYSKTTASLAVTSYVAGDVIEVVVTISAGTGTLTKGVFATPTLREAA